jgi:hypothetical protein
MKQIVTIAVAALLVGAGAMWGIGRLVQAPERGPAVPVTAAAPASDDRLAALEQQLADIQALLKQPPPQQAATDNPALEARLAQMEARLAMLAKSPPVGGGAPMAPPPAGGQDGAGPRQPMTPEEREAFLEQADQQAMENRYNLEKSFAEEAVDAAWSAAAATQLEEALSAVGEVSLTAPAVECRERTCRVQVDHAKREDSQFIFVNLLRSLKGDVKGGTIMSERNADGSIRSEIYLNRSTPP